MVHPRHEFGIAVMWSLAGLAGRTPTTVEDGILMDPVAFNQGGRLYEISNAVGAVLNRRTPVTGEET